MQCIVRVESGRGDNDFASVYCIISILDTTEKPSEIKLKVAYSRLITKTLWFKSGRIQINAIEKMVHVVKRTELHIRHE